MSNELEKFLLDPAKAVLIVIDIQERLVPAMPGKVYPRMRDTVAMLVSGAELLGVPVLTTEQYPQGIGHTVAELADACKCGVIEKVSFGCCGEPDFMAELKRHGRPQVIIAGMETHVCVYQTVLGLLEEGFHVHLVRDAVCSRNKVDFQVGIANAAEAGAVVSTAETVLFQMLRASTHEQFRAISKLVKARG